MAHNERGEQYIAFEGAPLGKETFIFDGDPVPARTAGANALHFDAHGADAGFIGRRIIDLAEITAVSPESSVAAYESLYAHIVAAVERGEVTIPALSAEALRNPERIIPVFIEAALAAVPRQVGQLAVQNAQENLREGIDHLAHANQELAVAYSEVSEAYETAEAGRVRTASALLAAELRESRIAEVLSSDTPDVDEIRNILAETQEEVLMTGPIPTSYVPGVNTGEVFDRIKERVGSDADSRSELKLVS